MIHHHNDTSSCRDALSQLLLITSMMARDSESGLAALGLTEARAQVVWVLSSGESLTQRDLARRLRVTPRNVTALIDALERTGFVQRTPHDRDRRAFVVVLTPKGKATAERLQHDMTGLAEALFAELDPKDFEVFHTVLAATGQRLAELIAANP